MPFPPSTPRARYAVAVPTDAEAQDAWAAWERHLDAGRIAVAAPPVDPAIIARRLRTAALFERLAADRRAGRLVVGGGA